MPIKRYKAEQIVTLLRQIEVEIANGKTTPQACKETQITVQTYYRWRNEHGGLKLDQAKRLKELERENTKLKRFVAELCAGAIASRLWNATSHPAEIKDGQSFGKGEVLKSQAD
jgi:putative transposase